jgi:hypothetical protein
LLVYSSLKVLIREYTLCDVDEERTSNKRLDPTNGSAWALGIKAREPGTEYGLGWFPINVLAHDPRGWPDNDRKERRLR